MNQLKTLLLLGVLTVILVAIGGYLGRGYLYAFGALAVLLNFGAYFWSDKLVLRMHHARELGPYELPLLHRIVERLAERAGIPKPRLFVLPENQPNAFATGRNPRHAAVAVTEGILHVLNEQELTGVLAHELSHVRNRDVLIATVAAAIAMAVTYIGNVLQFSALFGGGLGDDDEGSPIGALVLAILAPIAATLVQLAISRSRELQADQTGARLVGDGEPLARALEKLSYAAERIPASTQPATASLFIVNPFAGRGGLARLFSTHPPMEERIQRLRRMRLDHRYAV